MHNGALLHSASCVDEKYKIREPHLGETGKKHKHKTRNKNISRPSIYKLNSRYSMLQLYIYLLLRYSATPRLLLLPSK